MAQTDLRDELPGLAAIGAIAAVLAYMADALLGNGSALQSHATAQSGTQTAATGDWWAFILFVGLLAVAVAGLVVVYLEVNRR